MEKVDYAIEKKRVDLYEERGRKSGADTLDVC